MSVLALRAVGLAREHSSRGAVRKPTRREHGKSPWRTSRRCRAGICHRGRRALCQRTNNGKSTCRHLRPNGGGCDDLAATKVRYHAGWRRPSSPRAQSWGELHEYSRTGARRHRYAVWVGTTALADRAGQYRGKVSSRRQRGYESFNGTNGSRQRSLSRTDWDGTPIPDKRESLLTIFGTTVQRADRYV